MLSFFGPRCVRRASSLPACGSSQAPTSMRLSGCQRTKIAPTRRVGSVGAVFGGQTRFFSEKRRKNEDDMDRAFPFWLDPSEADEDDMPNWVENVLRPEEADTLRKNHEELVRIFTETQNANVLGKKLMPVIKWFATLFRGKKEMEMALQQQGLEWKDINILQNWNDADGMVHILFSEVPSKNVATAHIAIQNPI